MHIWLVEFKAILHRKTRFFYSRHKWHEIHCLILPLFTHQVLNFEVGMVESSVDVLDQLLKIVRNRGHG